MLGRERGEPSSRLLELAVVACAVVPLGLVPGDRQVDESLEEVALLGSRGTPELLEDLVRGEGSSLTEQGESVGELRVLRAGRS